MHRDPALVALDLLRGGVVGASTGNYGYGAGVGAPPILVTIPLPLVGSTTLPPAVRKSDGTIVLLGEEISCGTHVSAATPFAAIEGADKFSISGDQLEFFADPWWNCIGEGVGGDWSHRLAYVPMSAYPGVLSRLSLSVTGYEYLAKVPHDAKSRVAAMRKKIEAHTGKNKVVLLMRESSQAAVRKLALNLLSLYQDPARRIELLDTYRDIYRRAASEIAVDLTKIEEIGKKTPPELQAQLQVLLKNSKPMIDEMQRGIREIANKVTGSTTSAAAGLLSSLSSAVPIIGAVIQAGISIYENARQTIKAEEDARIAVCKNDVNESINFQKYTTDLGFPVPWHATPADLVAACNEAKDPFSLDPLRVLVFGTATYNNLVRLYCLPPDLQREIIKWWSYANAMMSDVEIAKIFDALGSDPYGGLLASDEQVILVAAPIAAANGLPIDAFAEALWRSSNGWTERKDLLLRQVDKQIPATSLDDVKLKWEILDGVCFKDAPDNAAQIQWGVLAKKAFELVDAAKAAKVMDLPTPMSVDILTALARVRSGDLTLTTDFGAPVKKPGADAGTAVAAAAILLGGFMLLKGRAR